MQPMRLVMKLGFVLFFVFHFSIPLQSKVVLVPADYPTIKSAVAASQNGDEVVVEDGVYFEKNIIVDKAVRIRSKSLFGASIYGSPASVGSIFSIRAAAEVSGFILLDSYKGISQRYSPDVDWKAHDLILFNMSESGVEVNDENSNRGSASFRDLFLFSCGNGIASNDARSIEAERCALVGCTQAFVGSNHYSFSVREAVLVNCSVDFVDNSVGYSGPLKENAGSAISLGPDVYSTKKARTGPSFPDSLEFLFHAWKAESSSRLGGKDESAKMKCLFDKIAGDWYAANGEDGHAAQCWTRAAGLGEAAGFREIVWRIRFDLARIHERMGNRKAALAQAKASVDAVVSLTKDIPFSYFYESIPKEKTAAFEYLLNLLFEGEREYPGQGYADEAFLYTEKYKTICARMVPPGIAPSPTSDLLPSLNLRKKALMIARLQCLLDDMAASREKTRTILERLEDAEDEYKASLALTRIPGPRDPSVSNPSPLDLEMIRTQLLRRDRAVIEYFFGLEDVYGFCFFQDRMKFIKIPSARDMRTMVKNYLEFLTINEDGDFRGKEGGAILCQALLGDFRLEGRSEIMELVIIPDDVLNFLPFETLVQRVSGHRNGIPERAIAKSKHHFLLELYRISYVSSLSHLMELRRMPRKTDYSKEILAVSNSRPERPVFGYGTLPFLKYASVEIDRISRLFPSSSLDHIDGENSNEAYLKSLDLATFRVIHFAAHGIFNNRQWWRSAILLNRGEGIGEDGWLRTLDIFGLNLTAELVVLSACYSGQKLLHEGNGIVGLHQAFFLAGARAVLCSLWEVNDRASVRMMEIFYEALVQGMTISESLRSAKLDLLRSKDFHPRNWASLVLNGDGDISLFAAGRKRRP